MILLIHGPPAAGKTMLAKALSLHYSIPHISRDLISEWLSDTPYDKHSEVVSFISQAGYHLMFALAGEMSKGQGQFIIEGCLNPESGGKQLKDKLEKNHAPLIELFISAHPDILVKRYLSRAKTGKRHHAHGDETQRGEELAKHLDSVNYRPLKIGDHLIKIDSTKDPDKNLDEVLLAIKKICSPLNN